MSTTAIAAEVARALGELQEAFPGRVASEPDGLGGALVSIAAAGRSLITRIGLADVRRARAIRVRRGRREPPGKRLGSRSPHHHARIPELHILGFRVGEDELAGQPKVFSV